MLSSIVVGRRPNTGTIGLVIILALMALILASLPLRSQARGEPAVFQPTNFALIDFDAQQMPVDGPAAAAMLGIAALNPDEDMVGQLGRVEKSDSRSYDSVDLAQQELSTHIRQPTWLPSLVSGAATIVRVADASSAEYTLELEKIQAVFQEIGVGLVVLPPELDGATLLFESPAKVIVAYGDDAENPELVFGQMEAPSLTVPGEVNVEAVRLALIAAMASDLQPLARQLEAISDWRNTVPIPVPPEADATIVDISGGSGVLFSDPIDGHIVLIWSHRGWLFGVFSDSLASDDLLRVANSVQ